jgi:replicative DNA helicase
LNSRQIAAKVRRQQWLTGVDLVMVDYIGLMGTSNNPENRNQELSAISRDLKMLAMELNVPFLVASQLNRGVEQRADKRPMLSDLRDSGALEQDADVVLFIYRDEVYNPNADSAGKAEIIIAKHRNGDTGMVPLDWYKETTRFAEPRPTRNVNLADY